MASVKSFSSSGPMTMEYAGKRLGKTAPYSLIDIFSVLSISPPIIFPDYLNSIVYLQFLFLNTTTDGNSKSLSVQFRVLGNYTISSNQSWLTINTGEQTGNSTTYPLKTLNITVTENTTGVDRTGTLTLTSNDYNESVTTDIIQEKQTGVATDPVTLSFSLQSINACISFANSQTSTYYVPQGSTFLNTNALYANSTGTVLEFTGYYSNGSKWRYWDKETETFIQEGFC